jgi:FemAB-related protein (PEP-CTERM system-associated)
MMQKVRCLEVVRLEADLEREWERYVHRSPQATCGHRLGWRNVVVRTYGHAPYYLMARQEDQVCGVLPLFLVRSRVFGSFLVAAPYLSSGGLLAETPAAGRALVDEARRLAGQLGVRHVELRNHEPIGCGLVHTERYCRYLLPLEADPEALWARFEPRARKAVRKGLRAGLAVEHGAHHVTALSELTSRHMRSLGTPFHGLAFYRQILSEFGDEAEVFVVRREHQIIGAGIVILGLGSVLWPYGGCLARHRRFEPMSLLTWRIIQFGCARGARLLDLGRSRWGSGTALFKRQWGARAVPLHYEFHLAPRRGVPYQDPANPRYALPIAIWKRLPLAVTRWLGPRIIRDIP